MDRASITCDPQGGDEREETLTERLDEDKIDQLRRWGSGLANAESDELRATGKAILLLVEEVEALHVDLWNAKTAVEAPSEPDAEHDGRPAPDLHRSLAARLRFSRRDVDV
jgi:hypothetical protein